MTDSAFIPHPSSVIPYGRQSIDEADIAAVTEVLKSQWLTQGPKVKEFEGAFAAKVGARYAVAVSSGTAALHAAMAALGIGAGDEVIVPPITFAATANSVVFQGATPVFADVEPDTLLIDPCSVEEHVTRKTKVVITVDYAGQPCRYDALRKLARKHGLVLVADACHALGAVYKGRAVGSLADLNTFSFHPVKHITTGEGGMITTDDETLTQRMRDFRTHGVTKDPDSFLSSDPCPLTSEKGPWHYEMQALGYNYRLSDISCALGLSQLRKLDRFVTRRREIAARFDKAFRPLSSVLRPLALGSQTCMHAYHLYVVQVDFPKLGKTRTRVMRELRERGVGTQVHYIPVHLQPFYRARFGCKPGQCPVAEEAFGRVLSLPMYPALRDEDVERVVEAVRGVLSD
ncbi:MAG: UDP-4-amino-4,6-dideoxy-N-acetyl-beta-L-altrosamine transaminase [Verrucomicrobia bacterium]|nr:UDP-4-amino-4,6-dideoxy-N-acetyl-beta-L-altrosamine transaminase [Verrucomicrobiota bacterium]